MRNFQDALYACKGVSKRFKKPCSPVFLENYEQNKTIKYMRTFVDIAKETRVKKFRERKLYLSWNS